MGVQSTTYPLDGTTNKFGSTKPIGSKQHMAVWIEDSITSIYFQLPIEDYELINDFAVLKTIPDEDLFSNLELRVADTPNELGQNPSDISIVAAISTEVTTVSLIANEVVLVAGVSTDISIVAADSVVINSVGDDLAKGLGANQPTDSAILNALTNANSSKTNATNAQLREWEAEAEKATAESYAIEPNNVNVKVYTSNGDGSFSSVTTSDFSALHWAIESGQSATGSAVNIAFNDTTTDAKGANVQVFNEALDIIVAGKAPSSGNPLSRFQVATAVEANDATTLAQVQTLSSGKASIDSPNFTGNPTTPTPPLGDSDTTIVNSEFVDDTQKNSKNSCTAWVNFNGSVTPPTIRDSYNVDSVTRVGTGAFRITFSTPMDNVNYNTVVQSNRGATNYDANGGVDWLESPTTTTVLVWIGSAGGSKQNYPSGYVTIFGGKN